MVQTHLHHKSFAAPTKVACCFPLKIVSFVTGPAEWSRQSRLLRSRVCGPDAMLRFGVYFPNKNHGLRIRRNPGESVVGGGRGFDGLCLHLRSDGSAPLPEFAEFNYETGTASLMRDSEKFTTADLRPTKSCQGQSKVFAKFAGPSDTVGFLADVAATILDGLTISSVCTSNTRPTTSVTF